MLSKIRRTFIVGATLLSASYIYESERQDSVHITLPVYTFLCEFTDVLHLPPWVRLIFLRASPIFSIWQLCKTDILYPARHGRVESLSSMFPSVALSDLYEDSCLRSDMVCLQTIDVTRLPDYGSL